MKDNFVSYFILSGILPYHHSALIVFRSMEFDDPLIAEKGQLYTNLSGVICLCAFAAASVAATYTDTLSPLPAVPGLPAGPCFIYIFIR
ncbi:MAG: hypothetical protein PHE02_06900 [Lachnospiraceae bacterium]|nr:hypothetical protein [Lachnospiraceae bacterium]